MTNYLPRDLSVMTVNKNFNKIIKGLHAYNNITYTGPNGGKFVAHLYPRNYVNLVNKYLNLVTVNRRKYHLNQFIVPREQIINWNYRNASKSTGPKKNIPNNKYVLFPAWRTYVNNPRGFGQTSKTFTGLNKIKSFMTKMRAEKVGYFEEKASNNARKKGPYRGGGYVYATPGQLAAGKTMARIRAEREKRKLMLQMWRNIVRLRKMYPKPPVPVRGANWGNLAF